MDDLKERVLSAARLREALFGPFGREEDTNAYRLLHAEGDGCPGVIADAYAGYVVLQVLDEALLASAPALEALLEEALLPRGIVRKLRYEETARGRVTDEVTRGESPPRALTVLEAGIPFEVELLGGFHTGLFTDMREERARLRRLARGRRVLNTFAYTGAFSVAAAIGGAAEVTTVDVVGKVIEKARRNFTLAGLDPDRHRFARMEVLEYLRMAARRKWRFDAMVLDPPTFAAFRGGTWSARTGYAELLGLAIPLLEPGGILWAAANTESLPAEKLGRLIAASFKSARREGRTLAIGGLPADYPTRTDDPGARYLKVHIVQVR